MKRLFLAGIWLLVAAVDGAVLPPLLGTPAGFGTVVFLIVLALSFGIQRWVIGWGIAAAFAAELFLGAYFGTLIGTWLVIVWVWQGLNRSFSLKPSTESSWLALAPLALFGMALFFLAEASAWAIQHWAYEPALQFSAAYHIFHSPSLLVTVFAELAVLLILIRAVYTPRIFIYG